MLRILLINDTAKKVGRLKAALTEAGFEPSQTMPSINWLLRISWLRADTPTAVAASRYKSSCWT